MGEDDRLGVEYAGSETREEQPVELRSRMLAIPAGARKTGLSWTIYARQSGLLLFLCSLSESPSYLGKI